MTSARAYRPLPPSAPARALAPRPPTAATARLLLRSNPFLTPDERRRLQLIVDAVGLIGTYKEPKP